MNVVGGNSFLRNLRSLEYFKMDLGTTKRNLKTGKFKKLSEFELKYANLFENSLLKYGSIGSAMFYEDMEIKENRYFIFDDDSVYEIHYTEDELVDFGEYIISSMRKVSESESEDDVEVGGIESIQELKDKGIKTWSSDDIKNGTKEYLVDQTLSKEEYRKQLMNKKGK